MILVEHMEDKPNGVQVTPNTGGTVQGEGKENKGKRAYNSPKHSQEKWLKIRLEYESGSWTSVTELSHKHGVNLKTLFSRISTENWRERRKEMLSKAEARVEKAVVKEASEADVYLKNSFKRAVRYEAIADASIAQAGLNENGVPLVDPDQLDQVTRSLVRLHELAKSSLRLPTVSMDVTSGGKDLGASFVQAIAKLRASPEKLGNEDLSKVLEAEVE